MLLRIRPIYQHIVVALSLLFVSCHTKQGQFYHVKRGDTATQIAHIHDIEVDDIQKANPQRNLNQIIAGQRLWIPSTKKVSRGNEQVQRVIHEQKVESAPKKTKAKPSVRVKNDLDFHWPYRGKVISGFGKRNLKMHNGIDIELPSEHVIKASQSGKVAYVGDGIEGYGRTIILQHPDTLFTIYSYVGTVSVRKGHMVKQGQAVAKARKQSGRSFFHFEMRKVKTALDPEKFLK